MAALVEKNTRRRGEKKEFDRSPLKKEAYILGLIERVAHKSEVILQSAPQLGAVLPVLQTALHMENVNTRIEQMTDFPDETIQSHLVSDPSWWANFTQLVAGGKQTNEIVVKTLSAGNDIKGAQSPGYYWEEMMCDESKSESNIKITDVDGVHVQEIAVAEGVSPVLAIKQAVAQFGLEVLENMSQFATENRDVAIPRTRATPAEREKAQQGAIKTLAHIKTLCTPEFEGCNTFQEVQQRVQDATSQSNLVQIVRPDGYFTTITKTDFLSRPQEDIFQEMTKVIGRDESFLPIAQLGTDIPTVRYFDILGLSHINTSLTSEYQTHDITTWYNNNDGILYDRKLAMENGMMGFKVRLMGAGGENDYIDTTIDRILALPEEVLEAQLRNCAEKSAWAIADEKAMKGIADEPPLFVLSLSDGNKNTSIYENRAAHGMALAHLNYNTKSKGIEVMYSHGSEDGVEGKAMALAAGYATGTREEREEDDFFIYPSKTLVKKEKRTHTPLASMKQIKDRLLDLIGEPVKYEKKQEVLDTLGLNDVVSFKRIDYRELDRKRRLINDAFQKPLSDTLREVLASDDVGITNVEDQDALISILTPGLGMSNLLSFVSEKTFGKTSICVQPLIKKYRLSLGLAPFIKDIVAKLTKTDSETEKGFSVEEYANSPSFSTELADLQTKLIAAVHQTNLFATLSMGHIQILYLATQGWRGGAELGTKRFQDELLKATQIRAQVSTLGANTEKSFANKINPRTKKPPTIKKFITALSAEKFLNASIGLEGDTLSFRTRLTPEIMDGLDIDHYKLRKSSQWEKVARKLCPEGGDIGHFMKEMEHRSTVFLRLKNDYPDLNNSDLMAMLRVRSEDWATDAAYLRALVLVATEEKLNGFVTDLDTMTNNLFEISKLPDFAVTPAIALGLEHDIVSAITS